MKSYLNNAFSDGKHDSRNTIRRWLLSHLKTTCYGCRVIDQHHRHPPDIIPDYESGFMVGYYCFYTNLKLVVTFKDFDTAYRFIHFGAKKVRVYKLNPETELVAEASYKDPNFIKIIMGPFRKFQTKWHPSSNMNKQQRKRYRRKLWWYNTQERIQNNK